MSATATEESYIDIERDQLVPLLKALSILPRRPSPPTLWRWRMKGVNGVKLQCLRCGSIWMTTHRAVAAFLAGQTAACLAAPVDPDKGAPARSAATEARLRKAGLLGAK